MGILLEGGHGQDTSDDTGVNTEQHATETCLGLVSSINGMLSMITLTYRARKGVDTPSIDLLGIGLDGVVVDEEGEKAHGCKAASVELRLMKGCCRLV